MIDRRLSVRTGRKLEDVWDGLAYLVMNRPARHIARRELAKKAGRVLKDARRAILRFLSATPRLPRPPRRSR